MYLTTMKNIINNLINLKTINSIGLCLSKRKWFGICNNIWDNKRIYLG